ncbi:hypothetical protein CY35_03G078500 [Sphagnum magellanicum]|nr:hypothetical protein CY35_03G078500 [Sphagnum magellanicum]
MGSEAGEGSRLSKPLDVEEFRKHAHQMVDFVADYHRDIESFPVRSQVKPGYLRPLLPDSAPAEPETVEDVFADLSSKILPGITHWQSPKFFGYYPCNVSTAGILGEMLCGGLNVNGFSWITSPAATELETIVLDWLGKLLHLPEEFLSSGKGGGVIQGTASEAVLVVMLAARNRALKQVSSAAQGMSEAEALSKLVVYSSDQTHSCVIKACQVASIATENFRPLPTDASTNFALFPAVVRKAIAADVVAGLIPFFLCGTLGTTSSAAVDPLEELGDIAKEYGMWYHIDAAYAGNACICPEFRHYLNGVEKADSYNMNPHKWLLTNFDCSTLWMKDSEFLLAALSNKPVFLRNEATDKNLVVDYKDWQIPLGRRFRALKLWMVMRLYGTSGLQSFIRNHVSSAKHFESLVRADSRFEVMAPVTFSLVCFRLRTLPGSQDNSNSLNSKLVEALNRKGDILVTHTELSGIYTVRFAVGATHTELKHVKAAWEVIQAEASHLLNGKQ